MMFFKSEAEIRADERQRIADEEKRKAADEKAESERKTRLRGELAKALDAYDREKEECPRMTVSRHGCYAVISGRACSEIVSFSDAGSIEKESFGGKPYIDSGGIWVRGFVCYGSARIAILDKDGDDIHCIYCRDFQRDALFDDLTKAWRAYLDEKEAGRRGELAGLEHKSMAELIGKIDADAFFEEASKIGDEHEKQSD